MDRTVVSALDNHANLITALAVLGLCAWGIITKHLWFDTGVVCVGAIAYYLGATISFIVALILAFLNIQGGSQFSPSVTASLCELVGYALVARLGFEHRQEETSLKRRQNEHGSHSDQVIPWHVSNDMRTSLAAIRFLLFPVKDESNGPALEEAVRELARLESLFQSLEHQDSEYQTERKQGHTK